VSDNHKRQVPQDATPPQERRRIGRVVHDDRGNASVKWGAAPADHERPVLEVQGEHGLSLNTEQASYDPYSRNRPLKGGGGKRTDLRKLSEWIKQMRELEERRRNGGGNGLDDE
jgi:hypothetical protein